MQMRRIAASQAANVFNEVFDLKPTRKCCSVRGPSGFSSRINSSCGEDSAHYSQNPAHLSIFSAVQNG